MTEGDFKSRTFGYYHNKEQAIENVLNNTSDMHECYYMYIVVEEIYPGIHPIVVDVSKQETWFKYNLDKDCWESLDKKPTELERCVNFSIG